MELNNNDVKKYIESNYSLEEQKKRAIDFVKLFASRLWNCTQFIDKEIEKDFQNEEIFKNLSLKEGILFLKKWYFSLVQECANKIYGSGAISDKIAKDISEGFVDYITLCAKDFTTSDNKKITMKEYLILEEKIEHTDSFQVDQFAPYLWNES